MRKLLYRIFGWLRNLGWITALQDWVRNTQWWKESGVMWVAGMVDLAINEFTARWHFYLMAGMAVFCTMMAIRSHIGRSEPTPEPERPETWPRVEDPAARELNPHKLACWLDRRKPEWPLPSPEAEKHYDLVIDALIDEGRFGNERPLGRQSPPWAHPWGAQVYWERAKGEKGESDKTHEIELTRSLVRRYLRSSEHPVPEFLDEKHDDRFPWK